MGETAVKGLAQMDTTKTNAVLNRLLVIHNRSLPMYLNDAVPWMNHRGEAQEVLDLIVSSHLDLVDRIGNLILENDGEVDNGEFPIQFTGYHDLSFTFLLTKLIERQKRDIEQIEWCSQQLDGHPMAKALAEEALGAAKGHLQSLEELRASS